MNLFVIQLKVELYYKINKKNNNINYEIKK